MRRQGVNASIQTRDARRRRNILPCLKGEGHGRTRNTRLDRRGARRHHKRSIGRRIVQREQLRDQRLLIVDDRHRRNSLSKPLRHGEREGLREMAVTRREIGKGRRHKVRHLIGNPLGAINHTVPRQHRLTRIPPTDLLNGTSLHMERLQAPGHTAPLKQVNRKVLQ